MLRVVTGHIAARSAWTLVIVVALTAALVAGCGGTKQESGSRSEGGSSSANADSGGQIVWARSGDIAAMDPPTSADYQSWEILNLTYDTLVGADDDGRLIPQLAESWKQTSPTTYVFKIRSDAKFSNGRPMTMDDVVGSLKHLIDRTTGSWWAAQLGDVKSIAEDGPWTLRVTLARPRRTVIPALAQINAAILPMKELNAGTYDPRTDLLGTGPYKLVDRSKDESLTFERNPHYWRDGYPKADRVLVRVMPEDSSRVAALRDGSVDVATFDSPDTVQLLQGQPNITTKVEDTTVYWGLLVNGFSGAFTDQRLRHALELSIDRTRIRDLALAGLGQPSAAVAPHFDACDPSTVPYGQPDVAKAKALVDAAGAQGTKVRIITPTLLRSAPAVAQVIQRNLEQAGFDVSIQNMEIGSAYKRMDQREFELFVALAGSYSDPAMLLAQWNPAVTGFGRAWWKPNQGVIDTVDRLLQVPLDSPENARLLREACNRIAEDGNGLVPMVTSSWIVAYRSDKIDARIQPIEVYSIELRNLPEYTVKR